MYWYININLHEAPANCFAPTPNIVLWHMLSIKMYRIYKPLLYSSITFSRVRMIIFKEKTDLESNLHRCL